MLLNFHLFHFDHFYCHLSPCKFDSARGLRLFSRQNKLYHKDRNRNLPGIKFWFSSWYATILACWYFLPSRISFFPGSTRKLRPYRVGKNLKMSTRGHYEGSEMSSKVRDFRQKKSRQKCVILGPSSILILNTSSILNP